MMVPIEKSRRMNLELARSARFWMKLRSERVRTELSRWMETMRVTGHFTVTEREIQRWIERQGWCRA